MFVLGHLGIGATIARPWAVGLPWRWLLLGTLLPDLIDKPLYYGLALATGKWAGELGLISGTCTFGHTAILLLALSGIAVVRKSKPLAAICLGIATHLLLDNVGDRFREIQDPDTRRVIALLFPFMGWRFPVMPFRDVSEHAGTILSPYVLGGEGIGAALLGWHLWKERHQSEILNGLRHQRSKLRKLKGKFTRGR